MRWLAALLLLSCAAAAGARAQDIDMSKGGPIDVTSRDGMEWRQNEMMVVARGDARAVRGNVTVTADMLIARYRKKAPPAPGAAGAKPGAAQATAVSAPGGAADAPGSPGGADTGANEVYRLEAMGNVKIFTPTDLAVSDKAVYDIDQAVLLMTGNAMSITTPQQVMTARDTMEYWSQRHMAVGRGLATVVTADGRRVSGDVLVGFTQQQPPALGQAPQGSAAGTPGAPKPAAVSASGKLQRVEGFGHVQVRTAAEVVTGDRGVYVADTGIARLAGSVHITRGQNQLDGDEALVNMHTGISTLVRDPGKRVEGLVVPNDASTKDVSSKDGAKTPGKGGGGAPSTPARTH